MKGTISFPAKKNPPKKGVIYNLLDRIVNFRLTKPAGEKDFKKDMEGTHEKAYSPGNGFERL